MPARTLTVVLLCLCSSAHAALARPNLSRRTAFSGLASAGFASAVRRPAFADMPAPMVDVPMDSFKKIPGGGQYADLAVGNGAEVVEGSKLSIQWVLRRSNGYYVDGSIKMLSASSAQGGAVRVGDNFDEADNFIFTVGDGQAIPGVDAGVRGMKQGGKRRLVLPMKAAYTLPIDKSAGPLPDGYGPRTQITREIQRQDPYNCTAARLELTQPQGLPLIA